MPLYSGFRKVKFNRLLTLQAKISRIPKSVFTYLGRKFNLVPRALVPGFGGGAAPPRSRAREKRPGDEVGDTWESIENTVGQKGKKYRAANLQLSSSFDPLSWEHGSFLPRSFRKTSQNVWRFRSLIRFPKLVSIALALFSLSPPLPFLRLPRRLRKSGSKSNEVNR